MASNLDCSASNLLCSENASFCFDADLDFNAMNEFGVSPPCQIHLKNQIFNQQDPVLINNRSNSLMGSPGFALQSDDIIKEMVEKEMEYLPRHDYLKRLRSGDLDLNVRRQALEWISKASAYFSFGPLSLCLSINYLDRFLSIYDLTSGKTWTVQLLAVACLSIAAKMEEPKVPLSVDLQVGEPKFVFEAKTILRMELLVLSILKWKMQALTPCSFIEYSLSKISNGQYPSSTSISRSLEIISSAIRGIDMLEFRPSEIAAAVAIYVSGEMQRFAIDKAIASFIFVDKGRLLKCVEVMKDLSLINGSSASTTPSSASSFVAQSPIEVLDAAPCLSYKSSDDDDAIKLGSFPNSSHSISPDVKRRKQDKSPSQTGFQLP